MNEKEISNLLGWTIANFPNMQDKEMEPTAELWKKMLSDIPYGLAEQALVKVLSAAKFFPTVADIREAAAEISNALPMTAAEAWGQVVDAMGKYGSYRAVEGVESLSPPVRAMVKRFGGFSEICRCDEIGVIRGQFIKLWDTQAKREKELSALPAQVRQLITGVAERRLIDA